MAICIDCIHGNVCRNAYTLIVEPPNVCGYFRNKADFVEVVRCENCKHWIYWADSKENSCDIHHHRKMTREDFCSYGERRDT